MNTSSLKAADVEALTFIYAPSDPLRGARRLAPRLGAGVLSTAIGWGLLAGITWIKLASFGVPESCGL